MLTSEELATCAAAIMSSVTGASVETMQKRNDLAEKLLRLSRAMTNPVRRFFVDATSVDGESLHWFIDAPTPAEALRMWRDNPHFDVNGVLDRRTRVRLYSLPAGPFDARAIPWHEPHGITEIYDILADKLPSIG